MPVADLGTDYSNLPGLGPVANSGPGSREPTVGQVDLPNSAVNSSVTLSEDVMQEDNDTVREEPVPRGKDKSTQKRKQPDSETMYKYKSAVPVSEVPGHTGYLTFATLSPLQLIS